VHLTGALQAANIASQNKFAHLTFVGGQAIASPHPFIRYRPYGRRVAAAPVGFANSVAAISREIRAAGRQVSDRTALSGSR
jgi:hypothetical protein